MGEAEKLELHCMDCGHPAEAHVNGHYPLIEGTEGEWAIGRCQASITTTTHTEAISCSYGYAPATSTSTSYPCPCHSGRIKERLNA